MAAGDEKIQPLCGLGRFSGKTVKEHERLSKVENGLFHRKKRYGYQGVSSICRGCHQRAPPKCDNKEDARNGINYLCVWCALFLDKNGCYPARPAHKIVFDLHSANQNKRARDDHGGEADVPSNPSKSMKRESNNNSESSQHHHHQSEEVVVAAGGGGRRPVRASLSAQSGRLASGSQGGGGDGDDAVVLTQVSGSSQQGAGRGAGGGGGGRGRGGAAASSSQPARADVSDADRETSARLVELHLSEDRVMAENTLDSMLVTPGNPSSELLKLGTARLADALKILDIPLPAGRLKMQSPSWAFFPSARVAGPAFTVGMVGVSSSRPTQHPDRHPLQYVDAVPKGNVVVISVPESLRSKGSSWELVQSHRAKYTGVVGAVVDGLVRDVEGHRELGFFLFSQGRTVNGAREHAVPGQLQQPVVVDGVTVYPRDWVVADVDGVVFIPQNRLDEVIKMAEEIYLDIAEMIEAMGNGAPLHQAMKDIQFRG